ncbi:MAG: hypothetical protein IJZ70_05565 [Bacteroidales bacterium]|nr:hypothetical protein [Bacteroidales bacterium]
MAIFNSKKATVSKAPYELYMAFVDMRNFTRFLPEDKKADVTADYDSIHAVVQGFNIGVRVKERVPYSRLEFMDDGAPFKFFLTLRFNPSSDSYKTDFEIVVDAELNFMMKTLLGGKIKEALDKVVDSLVAMSEGRMPEGIDPSMYPEGFDPSGL